MLALALAIGWGFSDGVVPGVGHAAERGQIRGPTTSVVTDLIPEGPAGPASARPVKDRYVVRLASSASGGELASARAGARERGGTIRHEYRHAF